MILVKIDAMPKAYVRRNCRHGPDGKSRRSEIVSAARPCRSTNPPQSTMTQFTGGVSRAPSYCTVGSTDRVRCDPIAHAREGGGRVRAAGPAQPVHGAAGPRVPA